MSGSAEPFTSTPENRARFLATHGIKKVLPYITKVQQKVNPSVEQQIINSDEDQQIINSDYKKLGRKRPSFSQLISLSAKQVRACDQRGEFHLSPLDTPLGCVGRKRPSFNYNIKLILIIEYCFLITPHKAEIKQRYL